MCPTEIIAFSDRAKEFADLNCQLIAASTDTEECHLAWTKTPRKKGGLGHMQVGRWSASSCVLKEHSMFSHASDPCSPKRLLVQIPIVADVTKKISAQYGVLLEDIGIALRGLFIINPEGVVEQMTVNNLPVGRCVDETLRLLTVRPHTATRVVTT